MRDKDSVNKMWEESEERYRTILSRLLEAKNAAINIHNALDWEGNESIGVKGCPFCHEFEYCLGCPWGEEFGICDEDASTWKDILVNVGNSCANLLSAIEKVNNLLNKLKDRREER